LFLFTNFNLINPTRGRYSRVVVDF
jgi:hypothetical protein